MARSLRIPAAQFGHAQPRGSGIKPTWGRVSRFGTFELAPSLDHVGTIARVVHGHAAVLLGAIASYQRIQQPVSMKCPTIFPQDSTWVSSSRKMPGGFEVWSARP